MPISPSRVDSGMGTMPDVTAASEGNWATAVGKWTGADFEAAEIEQDRDGFADLIGSGADIFDQADARLFAAMGGIDAHHVGAGGDQIDQLILARHCGTECRHNFDATLKCHWHSPHAVPSLSRQSYPKRIRT